MRLLALIPLFAFLLVTTAVGLRLLWLARRTRQIPELTLGLGLCCVGLLGQPIAALGRVPGWIGTFAGDALFTLGVSIAHAGLALIAVFTWSVFRRSSRFGFALLVVLSLGLAAAAGGIVAVGTGVDDIRAAVPRTRSFAIATLSLTAMIFLWSGIESTRYWAMLRRRLALGLSDPVLVDRFRLWALVGFTTAVLCFALGGYMLAGLSPLTELVPLLLTIGGGTVAALGWYLSFLPPERYLEHIRQRSRRTAVGVS